MDLRLTDTEVGAIQMSEFDLRRDGRDSEYTMRVEASATPRELAAQLGSAAGGPLGGLVGSLGADLLPARAPRRSRSS